MAFFSHWLPPNSKNVGQVAHAIPKPALNGPPGHPVSTTCPALLHALLWIPRALKLTHDHNLPHMVGVVHGDISDHDRHGRELLIGKSGDRGDVHQFCPPVVSAVPSGTWFLLLDYPGLTSGAILCRRSAAGKATSRYLGTGLRRPWRMCKTRTVLSSIVNKIRYRCGLWP
jgi:hypothetical protein